jgi:hypothetical protein
MQRDNAPSAELLPMPRGAPSPAAPLTPVPAPQTLKPGTPFPVTGPDECSDFCETVAEYCCESTECASCFSCEAVGGNLPRFWIGAEYLLWWVRDANFPVLATTTTASPFIETGVLGDPGTQVLFGGGAESFGPFSGLRVSGGLWIDPCQKWGIDASGFFLGERSINFNTNPASAFVVARPFINGSDVPPSESVELNNSPGVAQGFLSIDAPSRLYGYDVNLRRNLCMNCSSRVDFLLGYRQLWLDEGLFIREDVLLDQNLSQQVAAGGGIPFPALDGARATLFDSFETNNRFYGGQLGTAATWQRGRWSVNANVKVAMGVTQQTVDINGGATFFLQNGNVARFRGGLLALDGNIGRFSRDRFSVVPEVGITLGYQLTDNLRAFVGYNFLYWSNVVRPGDQIDRVLNPRRIPFFQQLNPQTVGPANPNRPVFIFRDTGFWAQGMTAGLQLTY